MASPAWILNARNELKSLQVAGGGWSYRTGNDAATEPSALAGLALLASNDAVGFSENPAASESQAFLGALTNWLDSLRNNDGSYPIRGGVSEPKWPTTLVLLLKIALANRGLPTQNATLENLPIENLPIANLPIANGAIANGAISNGAISNSNIEFAALLKPTIEWLLRRAGRTSNRKNNIVGHDGSIPGWPWIHDTHSWVEPTAWALIALQKLEVEGPQLQERVDLGRRLLLDRVIKSGGWNYGNNKMFGVQLRPRTAPTGLALLALAANRTRVTALATETSEKTASEKTATESVAKSLDYLERELRTIRSPQSLSWGLLGLAAFGRTPDYAEAALSESYDRTTGRADATIQLSYLLLAAENCGLKLLQPTGATTQHTEPVAS